MGKTRSQTRQFEILCFILIWLYTFIAYNFFGVLKTKYFQLKNKQAVDNIYNIMVHENDNTKDTKLNSLHKWNELIDGKIQENIKTINNEMLNNLGGDFEYIPSVTELYWSSKGNNNSDKQYVSTHMDGPFYYCNMVRVLVTINGNNNIKTVFPNEKLDISLIKYDVVMFDYNKTPHYIYVDENEHDDDSQRIIIKLHYAKSPFKKHCEKIHCRFARQTRDIFERNKTALYLEGLIAKTGLHYYTFRNYVLLAVMLCLIYVAYYNKKSNVIYLSYLFAFIEIGLLIYTFHFSFLTHQQCPT